MVIVDPNIAVRTERLLLRPLTSNDAEDVLLMRRDAEVMKHTSILPSPSLSKTQAWIQGCFDSDINWNFAIELASPGHADPPQPPQPRVIGLIGAVRAPEIGYMLHPSVWGRGYATEALLAFLPLFFEHYSGSATEAKPSSQLQHDDAARTILVPRFDYAEAHTDPAHIASHNILRKAGFSEYERRERDFENPVLGWRDTVVWRMNRSDVGRCVQLSK